MQRVGLDQSVQDAVRARMESVGIQVVTGAGAIEVSPPEMRYGEGRIVVTSGPNAGKVLQCDAFISATGREGLCAALDPAAAGLQEPKWGCMEVEGPTMRCLPAEGRDEREPPPRIFAAGDAAYGSDVSPPGLLSTGKAEAYVATHAAFPDLMESEIGMMGVYEHFCPCAVWIEPDIAYVGYTSDAAEEQFGGKDEVGSSKVFFTETVKGCIEKEKGQAARDHFFKVVYKVNEPGSGRILGVHVYGYEASEMIHNAGTLVNSGKTVSTCGRRAGRGRGLTEEHKGLRHRPDRAPGGDDAGVPQDRLHAGRPRHHREDLRPGRVRRALHPPREPGPRLPAGAQPGAAHRVEEKRVEEGRNPQASVVARLPQRPMCIPARFSIGKVDDACHPRRRPATALCPPPAGRKTEQDGVESFAERSSSEKQQNRRIRMFVECGPALSGPTLCVWRGCGLSSSPLP